MHTRYPKAVVSVVAVVALIAVVALTPATAAAQTGPRTAWGDPDLQGTYTNKTTTPLQRPDNVADREFLTAEEVANRERAALDRNEELLLAAPRRTAVGGNVGATTSGWTGAQDPPTARH